MPAWSKKTLPVTDTGRTTTSELNQTSGLLWLTYFSSLHRARACKRPQSGTTENGPLRVVGGEHENHLQASDRHCLS